MSPVPIPRPPGGTCATCRWGDRAGTKACRRPFGPDATPDEWREMIDSLAAGGGCDRYGDLGTYHSFWGTWCRHWGAAPDYTAPPADVPVYPAFTRGRYIVALCPGCGGFETIGPGTAGTLTDRHHPYHHDGGIYFADVVGPMTHTAKQIRRVGRLHGRDIWIDSLGPTTKAYRFETPAEAAGMVDDVFLRGCASVSDAIMREILRYLHLGDAYPFRCNFERQIRDGWCTSDNGQMILSPVPTDRTMRRPSP